MHRERHRTQRIGWLRASVLGANDGLISTASLVLGVAASGAGREAVLLTGVAGLVAGAMSMAAGEYVSVSSQADTEAADRARERAELAADPEAEHEELTQIYVDRGLDRELADRVARKLEANDALEAHLRDELGHVEALAARPLQAALTSAATFAAGAIPAVLVAVFTAPAIVAPMLAGSTLLLLAVLGALAAAAGGASPARGAMRVALGGAAALAASAVVGRVFGATLS